MPRYTDLHLPDRVAGPGDARPTALQIVKDENLVDQLAGKVYLVTGAASGIGLETVRALRATGASVYGAVRNVSAAKDVFARAFGEEPLSGGKLGLIPMDLSDLSSVRQGAQQLLQETGGVLHGIVANAGVMALPEGRTKDGWETQFGTNYLGHFLLFQLLKDALLSSATAEFPSRYVSVSSQTHRLSSVRFDNLNSELSYDPWLAYGQSKTANIWLANSIERHFGKDNLHATSLHPGVMGDTGLSRHFTTEQLSSFNFDDPVQNNWMKNSEQGAATQVYALISSDWKHKGGRFLATCEEVRSAKEYEKEGRVDFQNDGYADWAYDKEGEEKLWNLSFKMVGLEVV